jgi:hypothetical protein
MRATVRGVIGVPEAGVSPQLAQAFSTKGRSHRIVDWNPEDAAAWDAGNKNIARPGSGSPSPSAR